MAYIARDDAVVAETISTLTPHFTATLPAPVTTSPVVAGGTIYVGAGNMVYGIDDTDGHITWSGSVPTGTGGGGQYGSPSSDIAVGDGLLVVPAGSTLSAFGPQPGGSFNAVTPARVLDTRVGNGAAGPVAAKGTVSLAVSGRGGVPTSDVSAVVLNVTVTATHKAGYITVYPHGSSRPGTSNLNFRAGQTVPNLVIVPVGTDGKIDLYNGSDGTVHLVADVAGWIAY